MSQGRIALFDMDGTLYDHDTALRRDLCKLVAPEENIVVDTIMSCPNLHELAKEPHIQARIDLIRKQPGWWFELEKFQLGWDVYQVAVEIGFCTKILTKGPRSKSRAWMEKVDVVTRDLGEDMPVDIVGKDKGGTYGRVLVDDYFPYLLKWLKYRTRGLGIMPAHPHNAEFEHPRVIRYDGHNILAVREALQAAYDRPPNEHWKDHIKPTG